MGFRLRRSFKVFPGCRINVGKRGFSVSIGGHGSTFNISKRGVRATAGIPGTGISYSGYILKAGGGAGGRISSGNRQSSLLSGSNGSLLAFDGESIESASIDSLTSNGLQNFHDLIAKAREDRKVAHEMLKETDAEITQMGNELERLKKSLFRFFFKKKDYGSWVTSC